MLRYISVLILLFPIAAFSQTTFYPIGSEETQLVDKIETLSGAFSTKLNTSIKPLARNHSVELLLDFYKKKDYLKNINQPPNLIENHNIERALSISGEWVYDERGNNWSIPSKKPIFKYLYQTKADFLHVDEHDFFLVVNPVLYVQLGGDLLKGKETFINTRGVELRGRILNRIGFYSMLADNQEKVPNYVDAMGRNSESITGYDYYRRTGENAYDVFLAKGYFDVNVINDHLNVAFGYDHFFIGDGHRSLILGNTTAPATFLRLRSQWRNWHYENIYMELTPDYKRGSDAILPHNYSAIHQLSYTPSAKWNISLTEATIFQHENNFKATNLIPIIGYNSIAKGLGAEQQSYWALNFKAIAWNTVQIYGQGIVNEFGFGKKGNYNKKVGGQLGAKYFNAFKVNNLDLQGEVNVVRPFTYSADNALTNYTHYNQPLAHPLGANFLEIIGKVRYQPFAKIWVNAELMALQRGVDTAALINNGSNPFKNTNLKDPSEDSYSLYAGIKEKGIFANLNIAYEWRPNIILEIGGSYLKRGGAHISQPNSAQIYGGVRWNISRRLVDYF